MTFQEPYFMYVIPLLCCILTRVRTAFAFTNKISLPIIFLRVLKATWLEAGEHNTVARKCNYTLLGKSTLERTPYLAEDERKISARYFNCVFTACQELEFLVCESHVDLAP